MEFKQVWLYTGEPYLAFRNEDGEYSFPQDEWTYVSPPEGIYSPYYFNGNRWVGSTKEEYEQDLPKEEENESSNKTESIIAETQLQVTESLEQLKNTQEIIAQLMLDSAEKDKIIRELKEPQEEIFNTVPQSSQVEGEE